MARHRKFRRCGAEKLKETCGPRDREEMDVCNLQIRFLEWVLEAMRRCAT